MKTILGFWKWNYLAKNAKMTKIYKYFILLVISGTQQRGKAAASTCRKISDCLLGL